MRSTTLHDTHEEEEVPVRRFRPLAFGVAAVLAVAACGSSATPAPSAVASPAASAAGAPASAAASPAASASPAAASPAASQGANTGMVGGKLVIDNESGQTWTLPVQPVQPVREHHVGRLRV